MKKKALYLTDKFYNIVDKSEMGMFISPIFYMGTIKYSADTLFRMKSISMLLYVVMRLMPVNDKIKPKLKLKLLFS